MEVYYAMVFETDMGKTVSLRVSNTKPDLPQGIAVAAMNKILEANSFDAKYGSLTAKKSLKCVKAVSTLIDLSE